MKIAEVTAANTANSASYSSGMGARKNPKRAAAAEAFVKALKAAGIPAELVDASDRNHGQINQRFGDPDDEKVTGRARAFLNKIIEQRGGR